MFKLKQDLENLEKQFYASLKSCQGVVNCQEKALELAQNGEINSIKKQILVASAVDKKILGNQLNELKKALQKALQKRILEIQTEKEKDEFLEFDPTFYSDKYKQNQGNLNPITLVTKEIVDIFTKMGFEVADGPLVEDQWHCMTSLNIPDYHPARAMQDTFYLKQKDDNNENYVLRSHTSSVQIRYGQSHKPPFRIISPGQVYRNEKIDATHDLMFHQIECLIIEKNVSVSHLKTLIEQFYQQFFENSTLKVRLRNSYFPYTNPSMEVDITNPFAKKNSKNNQENWLELGGCGLVHPKVIKNMGIDSNQWQGLAFGFGIDRMAQLKLGLSGVGQFFNGNLNFLKGK
jgi:phenylalanyl-tRNA synthetase alpha chain